MKRRFRAGGKTSEARGRKALKPKRRDAPNAVSSSAPVQDVEVVRLSRELNEAREQQTATSEVLQVISSSPGNLEPVFAAMLENAVRICDAKFGGVYRCDGDTFSLVATHNLPPAYAEVRRHAPFRPSPKSFFGRFLAAKTLVHCADLEAEPGYIEQRAEYVAAVELGGVRTIIVVPMLKENELIGAFTVFRQEVRPFTWSRPKLWFMSPMQRRSRATLNNTIRQPLQQSNSEVNGQLCMSLC